MRFCCCCCCFFLLGSASKYRKDSQISRTFFGQKFAIKIVDVAYLQDHLGKVLLISVNGHFYGIILE